MADQNGAREPAAPAGQTADGSAAQPAEQPRLLPWFLIYTFGRLVIAAVLIALLWVLGLPGTPGFLFGVLLAMPVSFFALQPARRRLTGALAARAEAKEALRVQLRGTDADDNP